jgi:phosphoenolpyruvate synthase/pyruvate phosphate dikinase
LKLARLNRAGNVKRLGSILPTRKLAGIPASRGKYAGKAKLVLRVDMVDTVEAGDVMVASSTTPELIIGILRAGAVVTNRGGVTSHAAVIAREFRKPCVVGCVNATRMIRDGSMVTVDGTSGIVYYSS